MFVTNTAFPGLLQELVLSVCGGAREGAIKCWAQCQMHKYLINNSFLLENKRYLCLGI